MTMQPGSARDMYRRFVESEGDIPSEITDITGVPSGEETLFSFYDRHGRWYYHWGMARSVYRVQDGRRYRMVQCSREAWHGQWTIWLPLPEMPSD